MSYWAKQLLEYNGFSNFLLTKEDKTKTNSYRIRSEFVRDKDTFKNEVDYLKTIKLKAKLIKFNKHNINRASQMCEKTNQFNLTTKRYTEADIRNLLADDTKEIFCFNLSDRFGNYGYTGLAIVAYSMIDNISTAKLDSFLMSCRVIGRTVEQQFFYEIVKVLKKENVTNMIAHYYATPKNIQVENFYEDIGFDIISSKEGRKEYQLNLSKFTEAKVPYIRVTGE